MSVNETGQADRLCGFTDAADFVGNADVFLDGDHGAGPGPSRASGGTVRRRGASGLPRTYCRPPGRQRRLPGEGDRRSRCRSRVVERRCGACFRHAAGWPAETARVRAQAAFRGLAAERPHDTFAGITRAGSLLARTGGAEARSGRRPGVGGVGPCPPSLRRLGGGRGCGLPRRGRQGVWDPGASQPLNSGKPGYSGEWSPAWSTPGFVRRPLWGGARHSILRCGSRWRQFRLKAAFFAKKTISE